MSTPTALAPDSGPAANLAVPPVSPVPAGPESLIGRGAREVADLLGEPGLKRRDPPAELWQYRSDRCVLDLFLYADRGNVLTVAHAEMRAVPPVGGRTVPPEGGQTNEPAREAPSADCLTRIRNGGGRG